MAANNVLLIFLSIWILSVSSEHSQCKLDHVPENWRVGVKDVVAAASSPVDFNLQRDGHVYEVGVFTGNSMIHLQQLLNPPMIWGFDSFEGLPPSKEEVVSEWHEGKYSDDPRSRLASILGEGKHGWIEGYYDKSLSIENDQQVYDLKMKPASYIDIDCDLYESTRDALDFFFRNGLIVKGTVIGYDDWWVLPCGYGNEDLESLSVGEGRAHLEMSIKYDVSYKCVGGACSLWNDIQLNNKTGEIKSINRHSCDKYMKQHAWGVMLEVVSINEGGAGGKGGNAMHGFDMTRNEEIYFTKTNHLCKSIKNDGEVYRLRSFQNEQDIATYENLIKMRSGLKLYIDSPKENDLILQHTSLKSNHLLFGLSPDDAIDETSNNYILKSPISMRVEVDEDGVDSIKIRRNPSHFRLCYSAVVSPKPICDQNNVNISKMNFFNHFQHFSSNQDEAEGSIVEHDHFAPICQPILRIDSYLRDVLIPPSLHNNYHIAISAWVMPQERKQAIIDNEISEDSIRTTLAKSTDKSEDRLLHNIEEYELFDDFMGFQCVNLSPSSESQTSRMETEEEVNFKNKAAQQHLDILGKKYVHYKKEEIINNEIFEYDNSISCIDFGLKKKDTSRDELGLDHEIVHINFQNIHYHDEQQIITFQAPLCGEVIMDKAHSNDDLEVEVKVSLEIDVDNENEGSVLIKENPSEFLLCYGETSNLASSSSPICQPLLSTASILPSLKIKTYTSRSQVIQVEAWLTGKSIDGRHVIIGRTSVLLQ